MSPRHIFSFSSVLLCVALTLPSFAQKFTGDIAGDLTDATGAMLPRATMTAQNLGTGEVRKAITSGSGSYRIPDLTVGKYKVTATAEGFKTLVREVDVAANAVTHTDFKMQIGQRAEVVTVEGAAPLVDLSSNVAGQPDPCGNTSGGLPLSPFFIPCPGTVGNSPRNLLIGPGLSQWDASLIKNTKITERVNAQFRWEVYNLPNRANFSSFFSFNNDVSSSSFGTIATTPDVDAGNPVVAQGGPRNMVFVLKLIF